VIIVGYQAEGTREEILEGLKKSRFMENIIPLEARFLK
jgi:hypothetical protein